MAATSYILWTNEPRHTAYAGFIVSRGTAVQARRRSALPKCADLAVESAEPHKPNFDYGNDDHSWIVDMERVIEVERNLTC